MDRPRVRLARLLVEAGADAHLADPEIDKLTQRVVAGRLALTVETADGSRCQAARRGHRARPRHLR